MIHIIIAAYGEPKATERAINAFLEQDIKQQYKIIVADPFPETKWMIEEKFPNNDKIEYFLDPDEGKSTALNLILNNIYSNNKNDIIISTDGDVYVDKNTVKEILEIFKNPKIGLICGRPISLNKKDNMFGYWSHIAFDEMNKTRILASNNNEFFELSGYLFAMRNGVIKQFPTNASEDNVIPSLFWDKGYKIAYSDKAKVYVLNPNNFKDWTIQKKRNIKGHIALKKQVDIKTSRKNSISAEAIRGIKFFYTYPNNLKEAYWFSMMALARLYTWIIAYYENYIKKQEYKDGWRVNETPSTRPLD